MPKQRLSKTKLKEVMSYLGSIKTAKKSEQSRINGRKYRGHFHKFPDGVKCEICGKYLSQFEGKDPNSGLAPLI